MSAGASSRISSKACGWSFTSSITDVKQHRRTGHRRLVSVVLVSGVDMGSVARSAPESGLVRVHQRVCKPLSSIDSTEGCKLCGAVPALGCQRIRSDRVSTE